MSFELVNGKPTKVKDPNGVLPYHWKWSDWLEDFGTPEVITAHQILLSGASTAAVVGSSELNGTVTAVISGGLVGEKIAATCRITTAGGYVEDSTIYLKVREK